MQDKRPIYYSITLTPRSHFYEIFSLLEVAESSDQIAFNCEEQQSQIKGELSSERG